MSSELSSFLRRTADASMTYADRAIGTLWFKQIVSGERSSLSIAEISQHIEEAGYPRQNRTRLSDALKRDRRCHKHGKNFCLNPRYLTEIQTTFEAYQGTAATEAPTEFLIPEEIISGYRQYTDSVLWQLNLAYTKSMFDCCAVMVRRLIETLLIEAFEKHLVSDEIKDRDGNFVMLKDLVRATEATSAFNIGRDAKRALDAVKSLGDRSAHNRRYIARKGDLDSIRADLRVLIEELHHLATQ